MHSIYKVPHYATTAFGLTYWMNGRPLVAVKDADADIAWDSLCTKADYRIFPRDSDMYWEIHLETHYT